MLCRKVAAAWGHRQSPVPGGQGPGPLPAPVSSEIFRQKLGQADKALVQYSPLQLAG